MLADNFYQNRTIGPFHVIICVSFVVNKEEGQVICLIKNTTETTKVFPRETTLKEVEYYIGEYLIEKLKEWGELAIILRNHH